ncbi:MAG TPA: BTAD domain-containing putative transcriptional regulator [Streptosporangiaceae bacterium]|nr:BTAD domain-containing putative transcriptional regulator [Streptosporangiaceae bacterium]
MMRFRLLGPLEVRVGEEWRGIGAPKWRAVLATLLINAGQVVSTDTLVSAVWGDTPPTKAANLISIYVLRLRRLLGDSDGSLLATRAPGYQLRVTPKEVDAQLFEAMVREGRRALAAKDPERAAGHLAEALALWHGSALADVPRTQLIEVEADHLDELKLAAAELRITAELDCGGHAQVVPELRRLLTDHALREGLWLLLMKALDGSGRHAEALDVYGQARKVIADELGVDPGSELRRLYADLLAQDTAATSGPAGPPAGLIAAGTFAATTPQPVAPRPALAGRRDEAPAEPVTAAELTAELTAEENADQEQDAVPAAAARGLEPALCPAQLPTDIADFTGREDQVKHLSEILAAAPEDGSGAVRVALVAGYGGLGKTSLAVHAAHRVRSHFPDGQLYVDLLGATAHPLPPADVLARFLRDLGVDGKDVPVDEAERAARYRTCLAGRRIMVVLDNARDAGQVRPLLPGSGSCAVLVTTRSRMPDLARTKLVDLNVLDDDEALTLFAKVVGDERAAAEPEATAELLDVCAGLPLAIRICAARLATRSGWTIRSMANRLRDEHRRLDELTVGDLAVRASFEVSFASLPTPRRGVSPADAFRLLGLWHGPTISTAAAAALFGSAEDEAVDALELLVDAHLLESVAPDRYKFHDLLRVYASERAVADLSEDACTTAITRLVGWYMRTADNAAQAHTPHTYTIPLTSAYAGPPGLTFHGPDDALAWYDSERTNIPAATRQAAESALHDIAWRLPAPLFRVFHARGNWADCIITHRIALDSARKAENRQGAAWVLNNLGYALGQTGDGDGFGYLEQALAIRREIGDRPGEAQTANNLGDIYQKAGRLDEALEMLHRAVDLNRQIGRLRGAGIALNNLGDTLLGAGRAEEAVDWLQQALATFTELEDADGLGYALYNLGRCHLLLGDDKEAVVSFQRALASHQVTGHLQQQARTLRLLGRAQARLGDTAEARQSLTRSAMIYDLLGDIVKAAEVRAEAAGNSGEIH